MELGLLMIIITASFAVGYILGAWIENGRHKKL
jgi:uncharacterized protein YneF (UPF0154 family)